MTKNYTRKAYKHYVYKMAFGATVWIGGFGYLCVLGFIDHYLK